MEIPVKIRVKSTIYNIADDEENKNPDVFPTDNESEESEETVEYSSSGIFSEEEDSCKITIKEPKELEIGESTTTLCFDKTNKSSITVIRDGFTSFSVVLDTKSPLSSCTYSALGRSTEFTVHTSKVLNSVKNGHGSILIDYSLLTYGVKFERIRIFYEVDNDRS